MEGVEIVRRLRRLTRLWHQSRLESTDVKGSIAGMIWLDSSPVAAEICSQSFLCLAFIFIRQFLVKATFLAHIAAVSLAVDHTACAERCASHQQAATNTFKESGIGVLEQSSPGAKHDHLN